MIDLYGATHIANRLGVTKATVSNWLSRHSDTVPAPYAVIHAESQTQHVWDADGVNAWIAWHAQHITKRPYAVTRKQMMTAWRSIAALGTE